MSFKIRSERVKSEKKPDLVIYYLSFKIRNRYFVNNFFERGEGW